MCPGRSVSLYFPHEAWDYRPGCYTSDIRGTYEPLDMERLGVRLGEDAGWGHVWLFDVAKTYSDAGVADDVRLEFSGVESVPDGAAVLLVDRRLERVIDLRAATGYSYRLGTRGVVSEEEARFMLIVGSEDFISDHEDDLPGPPERTFLHQNYPNPFTSSTIIRYDLAERDHISLRVYDASGTLVSVLYEGRRPPGRYEAVWMGATARGRPAAQGIYFCRMKTAGGTEAVRKILLVK